MEIIVNIEEVTKNGLIQLMYNIKDNGPTVYFIAVNKDLYN